MALTELTPDHMKCPAGYCPAVYENENGDLLIIGKKGDAIAAAEGLKIAEDELAIVIDPAILANLSVW